MSSRYDALEQRVMLTIELGIIAWALLIGYYVLQFDMGQMLFNVAFVITWYLIWSLYSLYLQGKEDQKEWERRYK